MSARWEQTSWRAGSLPASRGVQTLEIGLNSKRTRTSAVRHRVPKRAGGRALSGRLDLDLGSKSEKRGPRFESNSKPEAREHSFSSSGQEHVLHCGIRANFGLRISGFFRLSGIRISDFRISHLGKEASTRTVSPPFQTGIGFMVCCVSETEPFGSGKAVIF